MKRPFTRVLFVLFTLVLICSILNLTSCASTPHQLSTSVAPSDGGSISPSGGTFHGKVTLVATPSQYYQFSGWAGAASGNTNPLTVTMNSDEQIVAQFTKIQYTIQVTSNTPNGGTVTPGSGTYDAGTNITLNATAANGYRFVSWGGDATGSTNSLNILINGNKNITANFIAQYALTVSADPNAGTVNSKGGIYGAGTTVNLTATPLFPYAFTSWSGTDNNNVNPTTVTMNTNKSVSASFVQLKGQTPVKNSGNTYRIATISINLNKYEWVQGTVNLPDTGLPAQAAYIQGPDGNKIKDFATIGTNSFQIMASVSGTYTIDIEANYISTWGTNYNVTYTVYGQQ
jgi:Divergent InlB B-repeat domain